MLAGVGIGFAETAESTAVAHALPEKLRSNAFGVLGLVQSTGDLGATLVAGLLWSLFSVTIAFGYAALWMAASIATSHLLHPVAVAEFAEAVRRQHQLTRRVAFTSSDGAA